MKTNKKNVFEAYNKIAEWFAVNRYALPIEKEYLDHLVTLAGGAPTVLDIGCGTGMPMMQYLISLGIKVTGIDASHRMLAIARANLPHAELIQQDMRSLSLGRKFNALIAWHSFFHLPADDQPGMFSIFKDHLTNKGILLFTSGNEDGEAWGINGGEDIYHASLSTERYQELLKEHGFKVISYKANDREAGGATVWMVQQQLS